jgi:hypothetical protein
MKVRGELLETDGFRWKLMDLLEYLQKMLKIA